MTRVEAIDYLDNYRKMYAKLAPERFLEALDIMLNEPSLPSNLDEAANMYGLKSAHGENNYCAWWHRDGFKAGAEWMAGQGYVDEK